MKLLPKSEIDRLKAVEKRTEIDEGLKLAKKIDNLRETVASEEKSLEDFRRETVANIHEETTQAAKKRDELKGEVSALEDRKREALKPLDDAWDSFHKEDARLKSSREEVARRENLLKDDKKAVQEDKETAEKHVKASKVREELAETRLLDADNAAQVAERALMDAARHKSAAAKIEQEARDAFIHREQLVLQREEGATIKEQELIAERQRLTDEWRLLRDREGLLERNLKRTK